MTFAIIGFVEFTSVMTRQGQLQIPKTQLHHARPPIRGIERRRDHVSCPIEVPRRDLCNVLAAPSFVLGDQPLKGLVEGCRGRSMRVHSAKQVLRLSMRAKEQHHE